MSLENPTCPDCGEEARWIGLGYFHMLHCEACELSDGIPTHVDREETSPIERPACLHTKMFKCDERLVCEACWMDLGTVFDYIGVPE